MYLQNLLIWFTAIFSQWALDHFGEWMKNNYLCVVNLNRYTFVSIKDIRISNFILRRIFGLEKRNFREGIYSVTSASSLKLLLLCHIWHTFSSFPLVHLDGFVLPVWQPIWQQLMKSPEKYWSRLWRKDVSFKPFNYHYNRYLIVFNILFFF